MYRINLDTQASVTGAYNLKFMVELKHINIERTDIDHSAKFYSNDLGLTLLELPDFNCPGYGMYLDKSPIFHIIMLL